MLRLGERHGAELKEQCPNSFPTADVQPSRRTGSTATKPLSALLLDSVEIDSSKRITRSASLVHTQAGFENKKDLDEYDRLTHSKRERHPTHANRFTRAPVELHIAKRAVMEFSNGTWIHSNSWLCQNYAERRFR